MEIKRQQLLLRLLMRKQVQVMSLCVKLFRVQLLLHWVHHGPMWLIRLTTYRLLYQVLQLHNIAELIERTILRDGFFCFMSQLLFNL